MRRKEREVTDPSRIRDVIEKCTCCRIGLYDDGEVYIVPLNFGFEVVDGQLVFYFHGARDGRKMRLLASRPRVGFELDTSYTLLTSGTACGCSALYQSIVGTGTAEIVTSRAEKLHGLGLLMEHTTGTSTWAFDDARLETVAVFRVIVDSVSCKEHIS